MVLALPYHHHHHHQDMILLGSLDRTFQAGTRTLFSSYSPKLPRVIVTR